VQQPPLRAFSSSSILHFIAEGNVTKQSKIEPNRSKFAEAGLLDVLANILATRPTSSPLVGRTLTAIINFIFDGFCLYHNFSYDLVKLIQYQNLTCRRDSKEGGQQQFTENDELVFGV